MSENQTWIDLIIHIVSKQSYNNLKQTFVRWEIKPFKDEVFHISFISRGWKLIFQDTRYVVAWAFVYEMSMVFILNAC